MALSATLSHFFTVKLDPFPSPLCHCKLSLKKEKVARLSLPVDSVLLYLYSDVIVGHACRGVFKKVIGIGQFSSCPKSAGGLLWCRDNPLGA